MLKQTIEAGTQVPASFFISTTETPSQVSKGMVANNHRVLELGLPRNLAIIRAIVVSIDCSDESTFDHGLGNLDTLVVSRLVNDILRTSFVEAFVMARELVFLEANTGETKLLPTFLLSSVLNHRSNSFETSISDLTTSFVVKGGGDDLDGFLLCVSKGGGTSSDREKDDGDDFVHFVVD